MTHDNFAILITPCIFRNKIDDPFKDIVDIPKVVNVSKLIINNFEFISINENEVYFIKRKINKLAKIRIRFKIKIKY